MFGKKAHRFIYTATLILLAISIPISVALPNVLGGVLFCNWILEWNWKEKWNLLKSNKLVLVLAGFFFCFGYTFIGTTDAAATALDWLTKTPFFYLPVVMATTPKPEVRWQRFLLLAFAITTSVAAALCILLMRAKGIIDVRDGGLFISHIRFSICAALSILFCLHLAFKRETYSALVQGGCLLMTLWLTIYLFYIQVSTGVAMLAIMAVITFCYQLFYGKKSLIRTLALCFCGGAFLIFATCFSVVTYQYFHYDKSEETGLPARTIDGHDYQHLSPQFPDGQIVENGHKIGLYVCEEELREAWAQRSDSTYESVQKTLIRFLNSKNYHKDKQGVSRLTDEEVKAIEDGVANSAYLQQLGLKKMLYPSYFSFSLYQLNHTTKNSSVLQRFELWQAAIGAGKQHPIVGCGMACNKAAINRELERQHSELQPDMGAHNQFLTYFLMGGIPLVLCFFVMLIAPFFDKTRKKNLVYVIFWICLVVSMFFEDTLETTTGINLFLLFNSFFLFANDGEVESRKQEAGSRK